MTRMGTAFLPEFNEGSLTVQANTLPGTSLAKSDEIGRRVEQILLAQPEVVATARRTGRAEYDEHVQGVEAAEIDVGLRETGRPRAELLAELRRGFSTLPGTNVTIGQPISHRIDHMLSGTRASIAVKIFGDDLPTLRRLGERVRSAMAGVPGAVDVTLEQQTEVPFVRFVLNRSAIARYGLRAERRRRRRGDGACRGHRRPHLRRRHRLSPGGEVRSRVAGRLRPARRPADRHAARRHHSDQAGGRRAARSRPQHGAARERPAPDRHLGQRRRPRPGRRGGRHAVGGVARRARCPPATGSSTAGSSRASRPRRSGC